MPKLKTHRGGAKRIKPIGNGGFKHKRAFRNHILTKKTTKSKRQLRSTGLVCKADLKAARALLIYI